MTLGVSIIIDSYNYEFFVGAAIESALAQDHPSVQVIVIDDGSTDGSREIIESFGNRIEAVFQPNQGQVAACRNALPLAIHDIVIFLDSDDLLEPDAARTVANAWREGVAKVQYCLRIIDDDGVADGNIFPKFTARMTPETVRAEMIRTGSYPDSPTSGNAYDRHFLEIALPLLPTRNGFDGELNGIAPLYGDVISLNLPLGSYRIHGSNVFAQSRLDVEMFEKYLRHSEARIAFVREHYRTKGQVIVDDALDRDLKYQEYALVVEKLGKSDDRVERKLLMVARRAIVAAWRAPHGLVHRFLRIAWMMAVTAAPQKAAIMLVEQRFVPARRFGWLTSMATRRQRKASARRGVEAPSKHLETAGSSSSHA